MCIYIYVHVIWRKYTKTQPFINLEQSYPDPYQNPGTGRLLCDRPSEEPWCWLDKSHCKLDGHPGSDWHCKVVPVVLLKRWWVVWLKSLTYNLRTNQPNIIYQVISPCLWLLKTHETPYLSLEVKLPTIWTDGKPVTARVRRKVEKVAKHCVFQYFGVPEGRKAGLKQRVRSHVKKTKDTSRPKHILAAELLKKCHRCRTKHVWKSKCTKHLWKLRCWKSGQRCGAKHISKSKR